MPDNLWIAASSPQLTIALAVLLAFTFAIAALLPQLPAGLDAVAASRWLSTTAARYGRVGPFLSSSGLLNVLAGPWIMALLALTAFHLLLRCANQLRRLAASRFPGQVAPQGLPFELVNLPAPIESLAPKLEAFVALGRGGAVVTSISDASRPRADAYVEHRSWAATGPLLTYAGPLLILLGLFWNTAGGWRASSIPLTPGRAVQPAQAGGLALSLVSPGQPDEDALAVVSLTQGARTRHAWLGYMRPVVWGSVWVSQRTSGPALQVRASSGGQPAPLQALQGEGAPTDSLHLRFGQNESEQAFSIPGRDLAFRVVSYESLAERSIDRPVFLIEGYQGADPVPALNALVEDQSTIEWQGVTLSLQREAHVVVDLAGMPGLPLMVFGGLVLLLGASVTAWGGLTRTWINAAAERDGTLIAVRVAAPAVGQAEVARLARFLADVPAPGAPAEGASDAGTGSDGSQAAPQRFALGAALSLPRAGLGLVGAVLLAGVGAAVLRGAGAYTPQARTWLFALHLALAALGLGAFVLAAAESLGFAFKGSRPAEVLDPAFPAERQAMRGRAGDPGRLGALVAFPLLTAAMLLGSAWGLVSFAAPVRPVASEMWLLVAWLLAAAYLHATSGWRPLRAPAWLSAILILAAFAAGLAACLAAASLLTV